MALQGVHHVAQKSTKTGFCDFVTVDSKFLSVISFTFAAIGSSVDAALAVAHGNPPSQRGKAAQPVSGRFPASLHPPC
jgi:hypothetical protein